MYQIFLPYCLKKLSASIPVRTCDDFLLHVFGQRFAGRLGVEGRVTTDHDVNNDSQTPHVTTL